MWCGRRGLTTVACVTQRPAVIYLVHLFSAWSELLPKVKPAFRAWHLDERSLGGLIPCPPQAPGSL